MKKTILALITFMITGLLAWGDAEVGKPAPDFTARDIDGKTHKLSDYKGKIIVLEAYNLDCPFCKNHFSSGAMQELQGELARQGVIWLVVNSSSPRSGSYRNQAAAQKEFKTQKMLATAWIDDSPGTLGKAYGLKTTPHMVVIDTDGVVAYTGAIDDRAATEGDPRTARNYVREAVGKLKAHQPVAVAKTKPYGCGIKYVN